MGRIGGDMDRLTCPYYPLRATKRNVEFAFKQSESLFEVVAMRRRPTTGRYIHVD
jgi:hypothetical protein